MTPKLTHELRDGRKVYTIATEHRGDYVKLYVSPHEGQWLWSYGLSVGYNGSTSLPFPGRPQEPPAATQAEALHRAAEAALAWLDKQEKAPRTLRSWLEEVLSPKQEALFEVTT